MNAHNVEKMLRDQPTPPPPEGLAERIKAEIPDQLPEMPELRQSPKVVPFRRRSWQLAAAAGFLVAITATVSWQLRREAPTADQILKYQEASTQTEPVVMDSVEENESAPGRDAGLLAEDKLKRNLVTEFPSESLRVKEELSGEEQVRDVGDGRKNGERSRQESTLGFADSPAPAQTAPVGAVPGGGENRVGNDRGNYIHDRRVPIPDETPDEPVFNEEIVVTGTLRPPVVAESQVTTLGIEIERLADKEDTKVAKPGKGKKDAELEKEIRSLHAKEGYVVSGVLLQEGAYRVASSTGGTTEPNDAPYGDVFFREYGVNPFIDTEDDRLSTFGLDVDTGSYTVVRRYLRDGHLPPREAVRVEELVNYFDYNDRPPAEGDFSLTAEGAPSLFAEGKRYQVLRFAVNARVVDAADRPPALLVFVVDVSGSMNREDRLGLVKKSLYELLDNLKADDQVGLVVYGSRGQVLLEPSTNHQKIRSAIDRLQAGGSTNAEEGLVLGYQLADRFRDETSINRIILCSDGVANVGRTGPESILKQIKAYADQGIELTAVGFGMGNYNDVLMEQLADTGDGRYAYVDALPEARKIFVEELTGTLMTIGAEAKAQVEFNPEVVSRYRLLGYENRDIDDDRFRDPTVDAGEIGAGHTVTALYEIKLHQGVSSKAKTTLATLRMCYRPRGENEPVEIEKAIHIRDLARQWKDGSPALRLATLVGEYAEILKGAYWAKGSDMNEVLLRAQKLSPSFAGNARVADWVSLVAAAAELQPNDTTPMEIVTE